MEKEFTFTRHRAGEPEETITVKESELSQSQKHILLGELHVKFYSMPDCVKVRFKDYLDNQHFKI